VSFVSGTSVGQAVPSAWLRDQIKAAMIAHGAYTFIEDVTDGNGALNSIFRCNAASNSLGVDFYVIVTAYAAGNVVLLNVAEGYTLATHSVIRASAPTTTGSITLDASGAIPAGSGVVRYQSSLAYFGPCGVAASGGVFDYWIVVTSNGVFLATRVGTTPTAGYGGAFDTLVTNPAVNDPFPIVGGGLTGQGSNPYPLVSSRQPFRANLATGWACDHLIVGWTQTGPVVPAGDLMQGGAALAARVALVLALAQNSGVNTQAQITGWLRGLLKDCLWIPPGPGVAAGDTVVVDGHTYFFAGLNNMWIDSQAA
jgi:hypothetical protein